MDLNNERVDRDREGYWKKNIKRDIILNGKFEKLVFNQSDLYR